GRELPDFEVLPVFRIDRAWQNYGLASTTLLRWRPPHCPSPFCASAPSVTAHSPAGSSALVEVGEAVRTGMTPFARVSGVAACSARAVAFVVFTSEGAGDRHKCKGQN